MGIFLSALKCNIKRGSHLNSLLLQGFIGCGPLSGKIHNRNGERYLVNLIYKPNFTINFQSLIITHIQSDFWGKVYAVYAHYLAL